MSLILRVDVDKPYGKSNFLKRVASKLTEDIWFPKITALGYMNHVVDFIQFCNNQKIQGFFYYRNCTLPDKETKKLLIAGNHKIGFHAENTRNLNSFLSELKIFKKNLKIKNIDSFTKHGSGMLKLGKHHYPFYEPNLYIEWSSILGISFHFGNGICEKSQDLLSKNNFFSHMFWIEREYRNPDFFDFQKLLELAKTEDVVVLIHPCNYQASKEVKEDFMLLVQLSFEQKICWKTF